MAKNKFEIFNSALIYSGVLILWIANTLFCLFEINFEFLLWIFSVEIIALFAIESFKAKTFENSLSRLAVSSMIIFYMGLLTTFVTRITTLENASLWIVLYFIFVFMCDSSAWFFGILFGKKSRGVIAASPNKSVVGFIGGVIGSIACGLIFTLFFPETFNCPIWKLIVVGFFTSIASIVGDLVESVFKRACEVKDSGWIIPGRGGSMDCLDSLILGGPVFYACVTLLIQ